MRLFYNISEMLTLAPAMRKGGVLVQEKDLGIIPKAAMVVEAGRILWLGSQKSLPKAMVKEIKTEVNLQHRQVLPGFVECHTHTVFAGNRAAEFELRNQGMSYQEIAKRGGGIISTVKATRKITPEKLLAETQAKVQQFVNQGVTSLEIKSGYGLTLKDELKMLEVAKKIKGPRVTTTFLGAHALPKEFTSTAAYVDFLIEKVLPQVAKKKLAERVDIFIESGFFTPEDGNKLFAAAKLHGLQAVVHAEQLSLSGGTDVGIRHGALSVDHVIKLNRQLIAKLAKSQTTAVLLPAADLYMKVDYPPARELINAGARVALATDFNPGTSPTQDLNLVGLLARLQMKMTLPEVIAAYTVGASYALAKEGSVGSLELGKYADFVSINKSWQELFYSIGEPSVTQTFRGGVKISRQ